VQNGEAEQNDRECKKQHGCLQVGDEPVARAVDFDARGRLLDQDQNDDDDDDEREERHTSS